MFICPTKQPGPSGLARVKPQVAVVSLEPFPKVKHKHTVQEGQRPLEVKSCWFGQDTELLRPYSQAQHSLPAHAEKEKEATQHSPFLFLLTAHHGRLVYRRNRKQ